ncbi:uncharacterized protein [Periplaneta americana]|uniref:uncharacterized protein n=1 Tax=Periplaneta americana TaxID=6978 RepID=UPI0037E6FF26
MEDLFKCPLCEVVCGNKCNLLSHVDKHEGFQLSCIKCHSTFKNKFSFDYHLTAELCKRNKKTIGQLRQCPECPQTFPNRRHLNKHVEGHKRNNCQYCDARLTTRKELTLHMAHEHKIKLQKAKYQCQFCERCFVKQVTLFNHYNHHANGKFVCQGCGVFLDTKEEFESHREKHEQDRPWKCTRCATTFSRRQQYVVHMESHEKYQCETCSMGFAAKATLQEHMRACQNHSGKESQHECPECGKIFSRPGQLKLHLRSHTGEEAYTCLVCKQGFQTAQDYNDHVQTACYQARPSECDGATRTFKCTYCDHTSTSRANMTRHLALHTERRRFVCDQCGAAFHAHTTLKDHCACVHSQQRLFRCSTCSKTFKLQSDLRRHVRSHSDTRPFQCQHCSQAYKRASHLRRHEEATHGTVFKPRRLQRLGHDETGALVPIVEESKTSSGGGVKEEPSTAPPSQQWSSPVTAQESVLTSPVLSLVDAESGKVITLQELCTVSDAQILTASDLSTTEVLGLPPDESLATIVTCADGTTLDSFQSGEVMQTIEVTYDLNFPTSQTLTTVLSSSEPQLVFATPITMSLDQTVLAVSEVNPSDNLDGKVQLLEMHDASKLPNTIFIEQGKLEGLEETMLLDGTEAAPHITIENFTALDDSALQAEVMASVSDSSVTLSSLPTSVETILQLPTSSSCTALSSKVLTSGSLLRERLMSGPEMGSSTLSSLPLMQSRCNSIASNSLNTTMSIPCTVTSNTQPESGISTLSASSSVSSTSNDTTHLESMITIPNSYGSISVEDIHAASVITSLSSSANISAGNTVTNSQCLGISVKDTLPSSISAVSMHTESTNTSSSISALIPNSIEPVENVEPFCTDMPDEDDDCKPTLSTLTSVQPSHPCLSENDASTTVSTLSVDALDVSIHPISIQPQDINDTHPELVMGTLPLPAEDLHSSSSLPPSSCSDESTAHSSTILPDFLPQNFPFLNVE